MHRLTLYLPQHDRHNVPIPDHVEWTKDATRLLCEIAGGATHYRATGMWQGEQEIIEEPVHVIVCYIRPCLQLYKLRHFIDRFMRETDQEAVILEYGGRLYTLTPQ